MNLDRLNVFFQVVRHGGFKKSSEKLGIKGPAISHQISTLEKDLGVKLLTRNKAGIRLTAAGEKLFHILKAGLPQLEIIEEILGNNSENPKGKLTIMTWYGLAANLLTKHLLNFYDVYPNIKINIICNNDETQFDHIHSDVTINTFVPNQPELIQQRVFSTQFKAYASKKYIEKHGRPSSFEDLDNHRLIAMSDTIEGGTLSSSEWHMTKGVKGNRKREPFIVINSSTGCKNLTKEGIGISTIPAYQLDEHDTELVDLFPDFNSPIIDFFYTYPTYMRNLKRITLFGDYLAEVLQGKLLIHPQKLAA